MKPLSPAAQAVLDAAMQYEVNPECYSREIAAAALRAVADQVVPHEEEPHEEWLPQEGHRRRERQRIRAKLLTITAELGGKP